MFGVFRRTEPRDLLLGNEPAGGLNGLLYGLSIPKMGVASGAMFTLHFFNTKPPTIYAIVNISKRYIQLVLTDGGVDAFPY